MRVNVFISAAACDTPALSLMDIEGDPFILVVHFLVLLLHLCVTLRLTHSSTKLRSGFLKQALS